MNVTEESDHAWKLECGRWTCSRCGHSFKWPHDPPERVGDDGSPAVGDKAWMKFQIIGMMSFINVGKDVPDHLRKKLVERCNIPSSTGLHAIAFKSCFFEAELDNILKLEEMMEM